MASPSDHLANERTMLAWIRTGVALIGFGFVIAKFAVFLAVIEGKRSLSTSSVHLGLAMIALGVIVILYGLIDYVAVERSLTRNEFRPATLRHVAFIAVVVGITIVLAIMVL